MVSFLLASLDESFEADADLRDVCQGERPERNANMRGGTIQMTGHDTETYCMNGLFLKKKRRKNKTRAKKKEA